MAGCRWLALARTVVRAAALTAFMPLVLLYLAFGRFLSSLLGASSPPTITAPAAAAANTHNNPPSARRTKRPRKQLAAPLLFASEASAAADDDDTAPDRRKAPAPAQEERRPLLRLAPPAAPPPPRPPPLALSADELRRLELRAPAELLCALDACVMRDAVVTPSGLSFERSCAERWLERWGCDPATSAPLQKSQLYPNLHVRDRLVAWLEAEGRAEAGEEEAEGATMAAAASAGPGAGAKQAAATSARRTDVDAEID